MVGVSITWPRDLKDFIGVLYGAPQNSPFYSHRTIIHRINNTQFPLYNFPRHFRRIFSIPVRDHLTFLCVISLGGDKKEIFAIFARLLLYFIDNFLLQRLNRLNLSMGASGTFRCLLACFLVVIRWHGLIAILHPRRAVGFLKVCCRQTASASEAQYL